MRVYGEHDTLIDDVPPVVGDCTRSDEEIVVGGRVIWALVLIGVLGAAVLVAGSAK